MTEPEEEFMGLTVSEFKKMTEQEYSDYTLRVFMRANGHSEEDIEKEIRRREEHEKARGLYDRMFEQQLHELRSVCIACAKESSLIAVEFAINQIPTPCKEGSREHNKIKELWSIKKEIDKLKE